jgi:SEC-C motif-containing protein
MTKCPCGSAENIEECCGALIGGKPAPTAEALMRSRYTAFVLGKVDYLQKTSAGEALLKFDRTEAERSLPGTEWLGLEIREVQAGGEQDPVGFVTFTARFRQNGRLVAQTERSEFRRVGGAWRYVRGEPAFETTSQEPVKPGRNDPCPCGSGKKYKKCCGA